VLEVRECRDKKSDDMTSVDVSSLLVKHSSPTAL
jgi:hypothetical protein